MAQKTYGILRYFADLALHVLAPATCAHCRADLRFRADEPLCQNCLPGVKPVPEPFCKLCGTHLPDGGAHCRNCKSPSLRRLDKCGLIRSAFMFTPQLRSLVHALKYRARPGLARYLAAAAAPRLESCRELESYSVLVPVPLSERRERERGFNQSFLVAEGLAAARGCVVLGAALRKVRDTPPQAGLGAEARKANLKDAFEARAEMVRGRDILLVDDVATTGSTFEACACALKKAGAASVAGFSIGRE